MTAGGCGARWWENSNRSSRGGRGRGATSLPATSGRQKICKIALKKFSRHSNDAIFRCRRRVEWSTKLKVPLLYKAVAEYPTASAMSSQTSVNRMARRRELLGVSSPPKKKRIKIAQVEKAKAEPPPIIVTNLQDLPDELMSYALTYLRPDTDRPLKTNNGIVNMSRASKYFRSLALGNQLWYHICVIRWTTKVGFAARLAQAEAEVTNDTTDATNPLIRGGFWYHKFCTEEDDALRSTMTLDELHNSTFSIKLWFQSKCHPEMKRIKGIAASGLDGSSLSDTMRFDVSSATILGMPESYGRAPFFIDDADNMSCINIRISHPTFSLHVFRRKDWGWEFRSQALVVRSVDHGSTGSTEQLWKDYASSLIIEMRGEGVPCTRGSIKYNKREVPDIEEVKKFLVW